MLLRGLKLIKIFLLALVLVLSTVVYTIFDTSLTILVMVPVDAGFSGGAGSHFAYQVNPGAAPYIRFELSMKIDELALGIAYLILY